MSIASVKVFPSIGIARLGNSRDEYFIGPEIIGEVVAPDGGFREATTKFIKRQAARFRLFGFDAADKLVGEITADEAAIEWTVHVANTKAAAEWFHPKTQTNPPLRNPTLVGERRRQLDLDAGPQTIGGKNPDFGDLRKSGTAGRTTELTIDQQFLDIPIHLSLGTILCDDTGSLLVLGGYGESSSPTNASLQGGDFADHDGWYDDVSDGPITAVVTLSDGSKPPVSGAWVIVAPPKFAPGIYNVVTLYDTLLQAAIDRRLIADPLADAAFKPSFSRDIFPILSRAANMRWVYNNGAPSFAPTTGFHRSFNTMPPATRAAVFQRLPAPAAALTVDRKGTQTTAPHCRCACRGPWRAPRRRRRARDQ